MTMEKMTARIKEIIKSSNLFNEDGGYEITMDYDERTLAPFFLKKLMKYDNPEDALAEELNDWAMNYNSYYPIEELVTNDFSPEEKEFYEENQEELDEIIRENCYYYYELDDFYPIKVNIKVNCGNLNYDYTRDNVLNFYGTYGVDDEYKGDIPEESSLLWLANQQGKGDLLKKTCKALFNNNPNKYLDEPITEDKFINSLTREYANLPSHMGTLTFLVSMPISKLFECLAIQKEIKADETIYEPQLNKSKANIVISKDTMCGLFDSCSGSGSVLEVELDKDVVLPLAMARFFVEGAGEYGYDINEVYGLISSCWDGEVKEINK